VTIFISVSILALATCLGLSLMLHRRTREKWEQRPTLAELRSRSSYDALPEKGLAFLHRSTFVYVAANSLERRLDHHIQDAERAPIGSALQQPRPGRLPSDNGRPSRFWTVRVEIRDRSDGKVAELVRPAHLLSPRLAVFDSTGTLRGIIAPEGRRRFALRDAAAAQIGTIERKSRGYTVDYTVFDSTGNQVAMISDFAHIAKRLAGPVSENEPGLLRKVLGAGQPTEHVLEITAPVAADLRFLMLGAAEAVFLILQRPFNDQS
jgi:hypothetical protein